MSCVLPLRSQPFQLLDAVSEMREDGIVRAIGSLPYVEAVPRFARAVGAARGGHPEMARADIERMEVLENDLAQAGEAEWAVRVGAQRLAAAAWVAWAEGDHAKALDLARRAAELEETVEKHPITPGPILPARELYADMLLEQGQAADAQAAYEATLAREPRRARALYGGKGRGAGRQRRRRRPPRSGAPRSNGRGGPGAARAGLGAQYRGGRPSRVGEASPPAAELPRPNGARPACRR